MSYDTKTTYLRRLALAALLSACTGVAAQANSLSLSLQARNADEARALEAAVTLYSIHRDIRAGADIRQAGRNHVAQLSQSGPQNLGIIRQHGTGHDADLRQSNGHNTQVILQYGNGAQARVRQNGGQSGILIQFAR